MPVVFSLSQKSQDTQFSLSQKSQDTQFIKTIEQKIGDILMIYKFDLRTNLQGGENGGLELLDIEGRDNCICQGLVQSCLS